MRFRNLLFEKLMLAVVLLPASVAYAADEAPLLQGFMVASDEWRDLADQAYSQYGFYEFRADGSEPFRPISPISQDILWATHGGTYANGRYYGYDVNGSWMRYTLSFHVVDGTSWSEIHSNTFTYVNSDKDSEESQRAYLVPSDMAYDPIGDQLYASVRRFNNSQMPMLCSVDSVTGVLTRLGSIPNLCGLTCDAEGNLFGIAIEDGGLYSIAKDGTSKLIGLTGYYPSRDSELMQSAACDFATNRIYFSMQGFTESIDRDYNRNGIYVLLEIDPATGASKIVWNYPRQQRFASLNILNAHPFAPADITDFRFVPATEESTDALITFTVPEVTSSGKPISGKVTISYNIDGTAYEPVQCAPGSTFRKEIPGLEDGNHTATVVASVGGHNGNPVHATTFFGVDVPSRVESLLLEGKNGDPTVAQLTWTAPQTGVSGSPLAADKIRYRVVRYPGEVTVARSLKETTFSEPIESNFGAVYYTVAAYHSDNPAALGRVVRSNTVMLGVDIVPPYSETFDTSTSFRTFTTIDVDGDGDPDKWESPCWKYDTEYNCAFYYGTGTAYANDWLITPPMNLNPEKLYKLTFDHYAYYGYGTVLNIALGEEPTVEAMTDVKACIETVTDFYDRPGIKQEVLFAPKEGQRFIGFHHASQNREHLSIDNISIVEFGDSRVPAAITDINGSALGLDELRLDFTAPSVTVGDKPLTDKMTIEIYRDINQAPVAKISDVSPGQAVSWTDSDAVRGINSYVLRATNSYGNGLNAEISVDMSPKYPEPVTEATTRYINDRQVEITWKPSATAADTSGMVHYHVHRIVSVDEFTKEYPVIGRDLTTTRFVDDDPRFGMDATSQKFVQYYISPVNGAGFGEAAATTGVFVGDSYRLPFTETWAQGSESTGPWVRSTAGATWYVHGWAYEPQAPLLDGMGLLDCEVNGDLSQGGGFIFTPRIDLSSYTKPTLTIAAWCDPVYNSDVYVRVGFQREGDLGIEYLKNATIRPKADEKGWKDFSFDLSDYADCTRGSIVLVGYTYAEQRIHLSNFRIVGETPNSAVRALNIAGVADIRENATASYTAYIANLSATAAKNVTVDLMADDQLLATKTITSIAAGAKSTTRFEFTPRELNVGTTVLKAIVRSGNGYTADETPATKELRVVAANYPYVDDLSAGVTPSSVVLKWGAPSLTAEPAVEIDGFEAYDDFVIEGFGGWTTYDGDKLLPFRLNSGHGMLEWPNCDVEQAFIVFNPEKVAKNAPFAPASGSRVAISFGSPYGANNDWLISPELSGEAQLISFYAASNRGGEGEDFHVLVSRTDNDPASFQRLNGKLPLTATSWDLHHFFLPEGTRYFAINYVGNKRDGLMIDDVRMVSRRNALRPDGYNIYRNGVKLNEAPVAERLFTDEAIDPSEIYSYTVRPVFGTTEGDDSNECIVCVSGVDSVVAGETAATVTTEGCDIVISGSESLAVAVYTPDGRLVASLAPAPSHRATFAPGVYIVKVGSQSVKVALF